MDYREKAYDVFRMFDKDWGLVTAGTPEDFNSCTVSWGSLGTMWEEPGRAKSTVTIYIHPDRYTSEFLKRSEQFTLSFFPKENKKALGYMGSHSGRDGDKAAAAGLTPIVMKNTVGYEEADLTFVCRKIYQHQFSREDIAADVQDYYASNPDDYPDGKGGWQPHIVFIGEILEVIDKRG